jgi:nucleotide-binding universal stress UspA family protein
MPGMRSVRLSAQNSRILKHARAGLKKLARRESKASLNPALLVRSGNSSYGIITTARERAADLIVIATRGYTGAKRVWLGSTAERVVRHAPCSVVTVPVRMSRQRIGKSPKLRLKKILVPIDFSKISETALPWTGALAAPSNAEVILLHVVQKYPIDYVLGRELMDKTITPLMKQSEAELKEMAARLRKATGPKISAVVSAGQPFKEICSAAKRLGADLIALTTHGYTGVRRIWLGSTAERVVRHAHCPVLVVR